MATNSEIKMSREHEGSAKTDNLFDKKRPVSPAPSDFSMRSNMSKDEPLNFGTGPGSPRPVSPAPTDISMRSNMSKDEPLNFGTRPGLPSLFDKKRPVSPAPSDISMRSNMSKDEPLNFGTGPGSPRPVSPAPTDISMRSNMSKDEPLNFGTRPGLPRPVSPAPTDISMRSNMSKDEPLNFGTGPGLPSLFDEKQPVSPAPSDFSMRSNMSKDEPPNLGTGPGSSSLFDKKQPVSPAPTDSSMRSNVSKDEPPNLGTGPGLPSPGQGRDQDSSNSSSVSTKETSKHQQQLVSKLKKGILEKMPQNVDSTHPNQKNTEHIMKEDKSGEANEEKKGRTGVKPPRVIAVSEIFKQEKGEGIRTVLTIGEAGVGKSFHAQEFVKQWATAQRSYFPWRKSKDDLNVIFPLKFSELTSMKEQTISLVELLNHFFKETKECVISDYEKFNIVFVLDGLDAYQPPLDFKNNVTVTDVTKPTSVDVLLTNLIRGNLLPSAQLWITSQPSAAKWLPEEYVNRRTEIREKDAISKLTDHLKKKILSQVKEMTESETDSELYEIQAAKNKEDPQQLKQIEYNKIFSTSTKVRAALTKGVAGIGKTFQTRLFMVDWAKGSSNKNIDIIVSLNFNDLNSRRGQDQSMEELLNHFCDYTGHQEVCRYNDCKVAFVLDGLEKCELPLDFEGNMVLTDIKKQASIDVLLTNLIKGNLLPSAHLWIISQPSGVDKIPTEYIQRVTECRETSKRRQQLVSKLKKGTLEKMPQNVDSDYPNQKNTEHIMKEDGCTGVKPPRVNAVSEIFKQEIRTVLTIGEAGVGKSFHAQEFIKEWAKAQRSLFTRLKGLVKDTTEDDLNVIFPLEFSQLTLMKEQRISLVGLLNHFFKETKECVISDYEKFNIVFVLDGLDAYQLPLNFENDVTVTDAREPASVDVLLTNLIRGNLLPSAQLWITSQPSAAKWLPEEYVNRRTEIREKDAINKLTEHLKKKIRSQFKEMTESDTDSELYEIQAAKNKEDPQQLKQIKYNTIFSTSKKVRAALTKGMAGIGKTFQTQRFMVDWAKGSSNKNIDIIVSLNFNDLNSRRGQDQSMEELLNHFCDYTSHQYFCRYNECKVAFVLDGLEKCELPLNFEGNMVLTDIKERASIDVLLTNLIKGKLLPSAHLWIISQPSGVDKIPTEYIQRVTECRETSKRRQQLVSNLKKGILEKMPQNVDSTHPNQKNTEHILKEDRSGEANEEKNGRTGVKPSKVNAVSQIFKQEKGEGIRTVLTIGEAGVGKSFHAQEFIKQWAKAQRSYFTWLKGLVKDTTKDDLNVIFLLKFSQLTLMKEQTISLVGLLNHFFKETKECVISDYEKFNIVFVLDGLDAYQLPLNFENDVTVTDAREPASVDVLLTNLIRGNLLPSAQLWITSRPSAAKWLPEEYVRSASNRRTEIREKPDITSQRKLKSQLKEQFNRVAEGIDQQKTSALLNEIYTDLYIIEGDRGDINRQHESRQVQEAKFKPVREETPIKYCDIFKPKSVETIRTVITNGVAGIGKTFASMKYMLDWAEGNANKDIFFILPIPFRQLNLRKDEKYSLEELLHQFFPAMATSEISDYDRYHIMIVLDGLDECRLDLKFSESMPWTDVKMPTCVNVLMTNLIQGNLLPKAKIWITSRPAASSHIPPENVDRVTEVRGFNDEQKEEYFRKRFSDKDLAEKIFSHVKKSRSLYIMCHIPVFCWISANVLEDFVERNQDEGMPKTLTDLYIHFLMLQCRQAIVKYGGEETEDSSETDSCWNTENMKTVLSLGKLAFEQLERGNFLFTDECLGTCGIEVKEAAVFSGLFTQIKEDGCGVVPGKLFCFVHMSIQEFLASFYVFHTFTNEGKNLIKPVSTDAELPASDLYKAAVDKALESKTGDWDLFLRFLLGLSLETNQKLLQKLLKKTENVKQTNKETVEYIKGKIGEEIFDADKNINLFHCLNELNDHSHVEDIKKSMQSKTVAFENFSASQWSALTFVLLTSDEQLDVFDLKKYQKSEKVLLGMLPVVKVSRTALLSWCELSEESCKGLVSSVLSSPSSNLTELDLSHNDLLESGVKQLAEGLRSLHCRLEILKLSGCQVTDGGCASLAAALKANKSSQLKELDLSYNHPGDDGKAQLSAIAEDPNTKLEKLCLDHGGEHRLRPGLKKYGVDLRFDENTAALRLVLSEENRRAYTLKNVEERVSRPENEDRFSRTQVLCEGLKGLCYWEVEWSGTVGIAVAYKGVGRKWDSSGGLGCNEKSWSVICNEKSKSLVCSKPGYTAWHAKERTSIPVSPCQKIAVFLDWKGGTLEYYSVMSGNLSLIHTFNAKFTEPVFPGFWFEKGSVSLCKIDATPVKIVSPVMVT